MYNMPVEVKSQQAYFFGVVMSEEKKKMIEHNEEIFSIFKTHEKQKYLTVWINYSNCPYGDKIMVFKDVSRNELLSLSKVNPHFEKEGVTPIARFNPHFNGWGLAKVFVDAVLEEM